MNKLKSILRAVFFGSAPAGGYDYLVEGLDATEYRRADIRARIQQDYIKRWTPKVTPLTDPLKFDPLNPPRGWRYDPYYECWYNYKD